MSENENENSNNDGAAEKKFSAKDAVAIAKERGLSLADAESLHRLAGSREEAEELATDFVDREPDAARVADRVLGETL